MRSIQIRIVAATGSAMSMVFSIALLATSPVVASQPLGAETAAAASATSESSENGGEERKWFGEASPEVDSLIEQIGGAIEAHPETFAGVALSYDRSQVNLYVAADDYRQAAPEVADLVDAHPGLVSILPAKNSLEELRNFQKAAVDAFAERGLVEAAVDVVNNEVVLRVEEGTVAQSLAQSTLKSAGSDSDPEFRAELAAPAEDVAGRYDDYPRFYMGGSIVSDIRCSLGIPIVVDGVKAALTAGHCPGGIFHTPRGGYVGDLYTTAYPGNADKYGDWKILYGSTYAPNIFSGPANSSSTENYRIVGSTKRYAGQEVCSSGQTTGEICRYVVETPDTYMTVKGVTARHLTTMYHDGNRDGLSDCAGFQGGDSGGPIYAGSGAPGTVNVAGIVKGTYTNYLGRCRYGYTQFDGVTAWKSNVWVDTRG